MPEVIFNKRLDPDPWIFETIAKMRLGPDPVHLAMGVLLGSVAAYDGVLNGVYSYDKNSVLADNGTSVIKPTAVTGAGRWRQVIYCPPCPDVCAPWAGDPVDGASFSARFRIGATSSNFMSMANDSALPGPFMPANTSFTIGAFVWMNQDLAASDLIARWTGGGNEQFLLGYDGSDNTFYFNIIDAGGSASGVVKTAPVNLNTWYLVAASFDALGQKLRIWLNGVQTNIVHSAGMRGVGAGLLLGARGGAGTVFDGRLETVWVHRGTVWTDSMMVKLFNSGIGVRDNRWFHFGLPMPTVMYEFETASNMGYNSLKDPAYDLVNSNSADGLAGLVTQTTGLPYS